MQLGDEPDLDYAIREIVALLAVAYRRRSKIGLVGPAAEPITTEGLAITSQTRPHELTLTRGTGGTAR